MSITAGAAIATAIVGAEEAEAASYKVKGGDSLWTIAQKYNTSVSELKSINKLSGDIIFPNQVLETSKKSSNTSNSSSSSNSTTNTSTSSNSTYTVKSGDTLSGIASKHNISLKNLMDWNGLTSTLIFPGNKFVVSKNGGSSSSSSGSSSSGSSSSSGGSKSPSTGSATVYTVKSGDSLSRIASQNGTTVANLKKWNNLKSDLILIGQKLNIGSSSSSSSSNSSASEKPTANVSYNVSKLVSTAKSQFGVPYVWGGSTPSGFDCSGFIYYAYKKAGMSNISRLSTDGYYNRSFYVSKPQVGDLVFFSGTYRAGISHMGIYVGNNEFIHAGSSTGVTKTSLNNSYWKSKFDGFKRFY